MENRAYAFAFLAVLVITCLGAYVAVSALMDTSEPIIRMASETVEPTRVTLNRIPTTSGSRTPTPTNTPFFVIIPTFVFPTTTPTPLPPTQTPTLPPFPTARLFPTSTPTITPIPSDTPVPVPPTPTNSPAPPPPLPVIPTNTFTPSPYAYRVDGGPIIDHSRTCAGQYYIYGAVRDSQGQAVSGVRVRFTDRNNRQLPPGISEPKGYELTVGTADNEWIIMVVDNNDHPISPAVSVKTANLWTGDCWYLVNWRHN